MPDPKDDKAVVDISTRIKLRFKADTIKLTERNKTKKVKKVSIKLSKEEAQKILQALIAKEREGCFSEPSQPSDLWGMWIEERQV